VLYFIVYSLSNAFPCHSCVCCWCYI